MKIPIFSGIYTDANSSVRVAYPVNMVPVPAQGDAADGYLRPAEGIKSFTTGQGFDRGAIVWTGGDNKHYRVSGTKLVSIDSAGVVTVIGDVGGSGAARMDFSTDRIGVVSNGLLYYWNGTTLTHVTDVNIGTVNDMVWVDGYWMCTDGTNIVVTNLTDPATVNALKYGNTDRPDPIECLLKVLNEVHVISRHYIDVFANVGGALFPFQRINTAVITKGAIGARAACVFSDAVAFVGGGINEAPSVYLGRNAQAVNISTHEVDELLLSYTESQLSTIILERVVDRGLQLLFIHLPDRTLVYDAVASAATQQRVWHVRVTALADFAQYRARNIVRASGAWVVGDPQSSAIGKWSTSDSQHYGADVRWEFNTPMLRNGGKGAIINQLELLALTGVVSAGKDPSISTSFSTDGKVYSQDRAIKAGKAGETTKRLVWFQQGAWRNWRVQRFRGDSGSHLSVLQLDAQIEALAN